MNKAENLKSRWAKEDEREIDAALSALLEHAHGKKFLWWLLGIGGVGKQPFANNALMTAFACGELNIGQQVLARIITVNPEGYVRMMKENANERSDRDTLLAGVNSSSRSSDYPSADTDPSYD